MPGATSEHAQDPILDPASATDEDLDASVDCDRIRVVLQPFHEMIRTTTDMT